MYRLDSVIHYYQRKPTKLNNFYNFVGYWFTAEIAYVSTTQLFSFIFFATHVSKLSLSYTSVQVMEF